MKVQNPQDLLDCGVFSRADIPVQLKWWVCWCCGEVQPTIKKHKLPPGWGKFVVHNHEYAPFIATACSKTDCMGKLDARV